MSRLRRAGSAARASSAKAYLKSDLRFWGTSQGLVRAAVREYCDAHPDLTHSDLRAIKDDGFWVRRTALLAEHDALRAGRGDFALWSRLAASMLAEREFFIRKAIGWVLREVLKKRPELTYEFLRRHRHRVSNLSLQEGAKYLPPVRRRALVLPAEPAWIAREAVRTAAAGRS